MLAIDASSIIHAWDNYPLGQFPGLWQWLGEEIGAGRLVIATVAYEEVERRTTECYDWLRQQNIQRVQISNEAVQIAVSDPLLKS